MFMNGMFVCVLAIVGVFLVDIVMGGIRGRLSEDTRRLGFSVYCMALGGVVVYFWYFLSTRFGG